MTDKPKEEEKEKEEEDESTEEETTEEEESEEGASKEGDSKEPSQSEYEAIAKTESEREPDPVRAKIAKKERDAKKETDDDDEEDEDKPLTESRLREILAESNQTNRADEILKIAKGIAKSDAEALAIVATHKNRSFPSNLSLQDQLEESQAIVNRKINGAKTKEMARALKSKGGRKDDSASTHRDPQAGSEPKMSPADASGIKSAGYKWDPTKRIYKKALPGGKFLYMKDLRSKTWIE